MLKDKAFKIASNTNYDVCQRRLVSMVYNFFDKKSKGIGVSTLANKSMSNQLPLANELHKQIITKIERRRVYLSFEDNIWGVYLADMQLISKYSKGIRYLLCTIDIF